MPSNVTTSLLEAQRCHVFVDVTGLSTLPDLRWYRTPQATDNADTSRQAVVLTCTRSVETTDVERWVAEQNLELGDAFLLLALDQMCPDVWQAGPLVALKPADSAQRSHVAVLTSLFGHRAVLRAHAQGVWAEGTRFLAQLS